MITQVTGKSIIEAGATLCGDLRRKGGGHAISISIGIFSRIASNATLIPPSSVTSILADSTVNSFSHSPMRIGEYTVIGAGTFVESTSIGSFVNIGTNCVLGAFSVVKDCCTILDDAVIPAYTIIPPFSVVGTNGVCNYDANESMQEQMICKSRWYYYIEY